MTSWPGLYFTESRHGSRWVIVYFQAQAAKEKGNAAYKAKNFDEAIKHYDEAIALDPNDMTYLNNKAGKKKNKH